MSAYPTNARTLQVHPANWVDSKLVTIEVQEGNRFQVNGENYWLEDTTPSPEKQGYSTDGPFTLDEFETDPYAVVAKLTVRGEGWAKDQSLASIVVFRRDVGKPFTCMSMGYTRDHVDPVGAAVQMILHTV